MEKISASGAISAGHSGNNMYYSNTASTLSKRPLGEIYSEQSKSPTFTHLSSNPNITFSFLHLDKKGGRKSAMNPKTKKTFGNITSKLDTGINNKATSGGQGMR